MAVLCRFKGFLISVFLTSLACFAFMSHSVFAAEKATMCSAGYFGINDILGGSGEVCTKQEACPIGSWQSGSATGRTTCTVCGAGQYTTNVAQTSNTCTACPNAGGVTGWKVASPAFSRTTLGTSTLTTICDGTNNYCNIGRVVGLCEINTCSTTGYTSTTPSTYINYALNGNATYATRVLFGCTINNTSLDAGGSYSYDNCSSSAHVFAGMKNNEWATYFRTSTGIMTTGYYIYGGVRCTNSSTDASNTTAGGYCWCNATAYQYTDSSVALQGQTLYRPKYVVSDAKWVYSAVNLSSSTTCISGCANVCANKMKSDQTIRTNMLKDSSGKPVFQTYCNPRTYTVTYSCQTGHGTAPSSATATYNALFTPAASSCTVSTGYSFSGWKVSGTSTIKPAGTAFTWTYTANKTFTAQYSACPYTITYSLNGDSSYPANYGTNRPNQATFDSVFNVSNPTRGAANQADFAFAGWTINNMDSGLTHYYGNTNPPTSTTTATTITTPTNAVYFKNLTAICDNKVQFDATWAAAITLSSTNGDGTPRIYAKYNVGAYRDSAVSQLMSTNANAITKPTRTGYDFLGYYNSANGSTQYINANGYITTTGTNTAKTYTTPQTWYAKWNKKTYSVKYDCDVTHASGEQTTSGSPTDPEYNSNYKFASNTCTIDTGYHFAGWDCQGIDSGSNLGSNPHAENSTVTWTWDEGAICFPRIEPNVHDIQYNPGTCDGDQYIDSDVLVFGDYYEPLDVEDTDVYAPTGYTFLGWSTSSAGTTVNREPGDSYGPVNFDSDLDLYGVCEPTQCTNSIAYTVSSPCAWQSGVDHPTGWTYNTPFHVGYPIPAGSSSTGYYVFDGWVISGLDSITHYYGTSNPPTSTTTGTSIGTSANPTKATWFKNLRATCGSIKFTSQGCTKCVCNKGANVATCEPTGVTNNLCNYSWTCNTGYHSAGTATEQPANYTSPDCTANTDTPYVVNHYTKNLTGGTYTLYNTQNLTGTTGATLTLANLATSITGFTYDEGFAGTSTNGTTKPSSGAVTTTTILADGTRVIDLYYNRNSCTVTFKTGNTSMGTESFLYGETKALTAVASLSNAPVSGNGWGFSGWQTASHVNSTTIDNTDGTNFTCNADTTLYGRWERNVTVKHYSSTNATTVTNTTKQQYYRNYSTSSASATSISLPVLVDNTTYGWTKVGWVLNDTSNTATATDTTVTSHTVTPAANAAAVYSALYQRTPQVTYNGNGNTGGSTSATNCGAQKRNAADTSNNGSSSTATLADNGFTKTNYHFIEWNALADGSGTDYAEGDTFNCPNAWASSATNTVYAQWEINCITITLDNTTNGGSGGTTTLYKKAGLAGWYSDNTCSTAVTSITKPTKNCYTYTGHYTGTTSGTQYIAADGTLDTTWAPTASTILYAQYNQITYTITFKTGNTSMGTQTCNCGATVALKNISDSSFTSSIPVSSTYGWEFSGWQTASHVNGTTVDYANSANFTCTTNTTLYGIWNRSVTRKYYNSATATSPINDTVTQYYRNSTTSAAGATSISLPALIDNTSYGWTKVGWVLNDTSNTATATDTTVTQHNVTPAAGGAAVYSALYTRTPQVTYNGNGNTGGATSSTNCGQQKRNAADTSNNGSSSTATLADNGFTKTNYHFMEWYTNATGTNGTGYDEGDTFNCPNAWASSSTSTLYVIWEVNCITITLDNTTNGGSGGTTTLYKKAGLAGWYSNDTCTTSVSTLSSQPTKDHFTYNGHWDYPSTTTGENQRIAADGTLDADWAPTSATTLYARYNQITHTITFKTSSSTMGTQICNEGATVALKNISTMSNIPVSGNGWGFYGWATTYNRTSRNYANAANYTCSADAILYGIWTRSVNYRRYNTVSGNNSTAGATQYYRSTSTTAAGVTTVSVPAITSFASESNGWVPQGWANSTSSITVVDSYIAAHSTSPAASATNNYYAVYKRTPTIVYDGNTNTDGSTSDTTCTPEQIINNGGGVTVSNSNCSLADNGFVKTNYVFMEWNAQANGNGTGYNEGDTYIFTNTAWSSNKSVILYAHWAECIAITLNNTTNGGSGGTTVLYKISGESGWYLDNQCTTSVSTLPIQPTKQGYAYAGHYTNATTGSTYYISSNGTLDSDWTPSSATTLYARYQGNDIDLFWWNNNSQLSVQSAAQSCDYGGGVTVPTNTLSKTGYTFGGWDLKTCRLSNLTGSVTGYGYKSISDGSGSNAATYGLTANGTWGATLGNGKVTGIALCSSTTGSSRGTKGTPVETQSSGRSCWCRVTSYTLTGESACSNLVSSWVFDANMSNLSTCQSQCAYHCGYYVQNNATFKAAILAP